MSNGSTYSYLFLSPSKLKKEGFGKYAKYEKQATPRLQFNKHFYGWKKYLVIAYNIGVFKMIKWGIIGYLVYRYWDYCWPVIKYGSIISIGSFLSLFLLRFGVYRKFGAATYEKNTFKLCSTRFETVFKEYDQLSTLPLSWLIVKTVTKCMVFRNHRKWLRSLQRFLDTYKPFKYYAGEEFSHGIAFQPLLIEHGGYYNAHFTWFIDRKELMNTYGWVEIKCEGNLHGRTMDVTEFRFHVNPREGGEVLRFNPFRISIDDQWNAELLEEIYTFGDSKYEEKKVNKEMPRQKLHSKRKKSHAFKNQKPATISDAEYKLKD